MRRMCMRVARVGADSRTTMRGVYRHVWALSRASSNVGKREIVT